MSGRGTRLGVVVGLDGSPSFTLAVSPAPQAFSNNLTMPLIHSRNLQTVTLNDVFT